MGLYNVLFGVESEAGAALAMLGNPEVGRFRDAWVERTENGDLRIAVYTRNGGGNRDHYCQREECGWNCEHEGGADCACTGCIITHRLPAHPLYLSDRDDDFDCTYATVYFRVPDEHRAAAEVLAGDVRNKSQEWEQFIDALKGKEA